MGNIKSRIKPVFDYGTVVTLPRSITQYIVTEYGMANLKGKTTLIEFTATWCGVCYKAAEMMNRLEILRYLEKKATAMKRSQLTYISAKPMHCLPKRFLIISPFIDA